MLRVTVADRLEPLGDAVADALAVALEDPFATEVIAVPSDGVRTWLVEHLATRLGGGASGVGICANIDMVFPSQLIGRLLGDAAEPGRPRDLGQYRVGRLTWAVYRLIGPDSPDSAAIGHRADLLRARAIADLFDRYIMHRPEMLGAWLAGREVDAVGRTLLEHLRWQPRLWCKVVELIGEPSPAESLDQALERLGTSGVGLPPRFFVLGLSSLPDSYLRVLRASADHHDVHLLVPTWSLSVAERIDQLALDIINDPVGLALPLERSKDPSAPLCEHPLARSWAQAPREAQLLLSLSLGARSSMVSAKATETGSLLASLQQDLRADRSARTADERLVFDDADRSIVIHRCHGQARQAEVIRDVVLHLLADPVASPRYEPRDIAILCPDPVAMAPFVEAAFAQHSGTAAIPLQAADRTLRGDTALMEVLGALLELTEGRFRRSELFALAALHPVRRRFGFAIEDLSQCQTWAESTNIAWGLDPDSRAAFGIPTAITTNTWQSGLDQLFVGATLADPDLCPNGFEVTLGPGNTVPTGSIEGSEVELLGAFDAFVESVGRGVESLMPSQSPAEWAHRIAALVLDICQLEDDDAWQFRQFDRILEQYVTDVDGLFDQPVPGVEQARLLSQQLDRAPGRVRFGTGAVTLSSLTAQRGVPHRVIVLAGLDGDLASGSTRADDLMTMPPCVGDREARTEIRSQLLDAVLAAEERLVITANGFDIGRSTTVPPAVPLAELLDAIDQLAVAADSRPVSEHISVEQPRHGWSEAGFIPGALGIDGPWSFDETALRGAQARLAGRITDVSTPIVPATAAPSLTVEQTVRALMNPVEAFARDRLGMVMLKDTDPPLDSIPLSLSNLERWQLRDDLLRRRLAAGTEWSPEDFDRWSIRYRVAGTVPPLGYGQVELDAVVADTSALLERYWELCADELGTEVTERLVEIDTGGSLGALRDRIAGIQGGLLVDLSASKLNLKRELGAWIRLLALAVVEPEIEWRAVLIGLKQRSNGSDAAKAESMVVHLARPEAAQDQLYALLDLVDRAHRTPFPALAATTMAIHDSNDRWAGRYTWSNRSGTGDDANPWVRMVLGAVDYADLLALEPLPGEQGAGWGDSDSRLVRWATRLWGLSGESLHVAETIEEGQ